MNNLEELKKVALAATPGPWEKCDSYGPNENGTCISAVERPDLMIASTTGYYGRVGGIANTHFIALANPAVILDLIAQLEAAQKELFDFHNQEFQQRLANAEHQLYMKDLAIHNIKASRKAQFRKRLAAEAELSAANEKLKGEQVPVEYQYRYHNHGTGCGEWCRVLTKERYEELQREHAGDNDFVFRMLFTAPQKPVALLDKYVRNEKGQYILDGKCEPRIGFAVGWNAAIRAAGGKVEGNADEK